MVTTLHHVYWFDDASARHCAYIYATDKVNAERIVIEINPNAHIYKIVSIPTQALPTKVTAQ